MVPWMGPGVQLGGLVTGRPGHPGFTGKSFSGKDFCLPNRQRGFDSRFPLLVVAIATQVVGTPLIKMRAYSPIAQSAEHLIVNQGVPGSSPGGRAN